MLRRAAKFAAACAALLLPMTARAADPEMPQGLTPPEVMSDPNGLNLVSGKVMSQRPTISIPAAPRLAYSRASDFFIYMEGQKKISQPGVGKYSVNYGGDRSEAFDCTVSSGCEAKTSGGTWNGGAVGGYYLQATTAVRYTYMVQVQNSPDFTKDIRYVIVYGSQVAYPDGETLNLAYEVYIPNDPSAKRLKTVTSNTGYFLQFDYWDSIPGGLLRVKTAAIYASANPTVALARLDYSSDGNQVTDMLGRTWSCTTSCGQDRGYPPWLSAEGLTLPGEGAASLTYTKNATNGFLTQTVTRDGVNWNYTYGGVAAQVVGGLVKSYKFETLQATGPNGYARSYTLKTVDMGSAVTPRYEICCVLSSKDELNRTTSYEWFDRNYLKSITYPEGNKALFEWDSPGNLTKRTDVGKAGSPEIVQTASYGAHYLWRIDWYKDALGRQTDYLHSGTTGQLTQQDDPPDASGVRRRTIIDYAVSNGISRKTMVRVCAAGPTPLTCSGNALSRTEYTYLGNTLLPLTATQTDEATGTSRVTTYSYDAAGRLLSEDGPRTDVNDTKYLEYDAVGRKCWELGEPDISNLRIAKHYFYRAADDKIEKVETGTATATGANCTVQNFVLLEHTDTTYDSRRYPIEEATWAGSTRYRVTDRSFLDRGLADCTTVRMNLAALPVPPASPLAACTLATTGSQGPDRITKNVYDNAGQLTKIQKAFGTTLQQDYVTYTYTDNSKQASVTDANGNKASYAYDGFDRLQKWNFPAPNGPPGTVSATDFEQYGYDDAGNRLSLRRRDGRMLTFTYDNLNRMLSKLVPDGCPPIQPPGTGCPAATATRDVFYSYDLLGRQLTAKFDATGGADGVTNTYDGFGNLASSTIGMSGFSKSVCSAANPCLYDADNNRTRMTVDGQSFTYTYDARDRPTEIAELGQLSMIGFAYDNFGRPSLLDRRNGRKTYFEYDPISRLSALINTSFGSPADVRFDYGFNPANQITTVSRSNDAYAFTAITTSNTNYTKNGLNQYTAVAASGYSYDASGNLTNDGIRSYVYDAENRLVSVQNGPAFVYDPLGRLVEVSQSPYLTRFLYDGDALVADYDASGTLVRRYVHGPSAAADDPLVQYDGAGLTNRRFLETDHQGSVILLSDNAGGTIATNRYDEYGVPAATNVGRFGYTGQQFMGELSLTGQPHAFYYYKARIYRADIGRFLQVDPTGYADQINLYIYVGDDPLNANDPTGLFLWPWENAVTITGGTDAQRDHYVNVVNRVLATPHGRALLKEIVGPWYWHGSPQTIVLKPGIGKQQGTFFDPITHKPTGITWLDPDYHPLVQTKAGVVRASDERVVGHELGHSVTGTEDAGKGRMDNINQNENPIAKAFGLSPRIQALTPQEQPGVKREIPQCGDPPKPCE